MIKLIRNIFAKIKGISNDYNLNYIIVLVLLFVITFSFIFNKKIDMNGDNCEYYMLSTSIAKGFGYINIASPDQEPSGTFPPGYPLIMSLVRIFTNKIVAQKILNGIFLMASSLLIFHFIRKNKLPDSLAFIVSASILLNVNILHFATMMMSEMSYLLFTVIALWTLFKIDFDKPFFKDKYFYLLIFSTGYAYHIRTQGIALIVAVICYLLITKKWKTTLGYLSGIVLCLIPWMVRNHITGVGSSRYLNQIFTVNNHRPEEGTLEVFDLISRFFDTLIMLVTKAIPNSITPYFNVDYNVETTIGEWFIAVVLFGIIITGFWQFKKLRFFFIFYVLANLSLISLFNDPGENRYITTLIPFLEIGLFIGLYKLLTNVVQKTKIAKSFSPWILIVPLIIFPYPQLKDEHERNKSSFPPNYLNFFRIAAASRKQLQPDVVICSRKPGLFYIYSQSKVCNYKWTNDDKLLIQGLIDSKVDYVVLDQLGYSTTIRYLYPAMKKHEELFIPVMHIPNPDTYLLKFDRDGAIKKLKDELTQ